MDFSTVKAISIPEGDVTQIASGQTILWKKPSSLQIYYIDNQQSGGSSNITGDLSAQMTRTGNNSQGDFRVYLSNYNGRSGIRITGSIVFGFCYSSSGEMSHVTFIDSNTNVVNQSNYNGETKTFDFTIYPNPFVSFDLYYFYVRIINGPNSYYGDTTVTVNLNIEAL